MWVLFLALLLPGTAFAAAPDYSGLVSSIDVSGVITGILSAAAILIGVFVVREGVDLILDFFEARRIDRENYEDWLAHEEKRERINREFLG